MVTKDHLKNLSIRKDELSKFLDIDIKKAKIMKLEEITQSEKFWENPIKAQKILKNISALKLWVTSFEIIEKNIGDLEVLIELEADISELESQLSITRLSVEDLEFKNMLSAEEDNLSAVMVITPGAGGTESQDWAEMIMRMYLMW